ncbi:putative phospholipid-transporting ATPase IA [Frankliniella fusca]|uniref:Phospholipid-transporting ATPase n=1 Tax=Frankliniella fusca TaxID=407009 RepID=A0AAE1LA13_9NEOP|nr:putative phospholipid-transporting ATPase IA [Frankliniella fusca]
MDRYASGDDAASSSQVDSSVDVADGAGSGAGYRVIFVNRPQPQVNKYCTNYISTAKYSLVSFFPAFLFEQFRRYSNCFFLFIAMLQQIPDVSPTGRWTTLVPLLFILTVSAIKETIEDIKRHRADNETNQKEVEVLRDGHWQWVKWHAVLVGDIVKVHNNNFFPADLIVLATSEPQAMCYIETSNLDGETNLKVRQGLAETAHFLKTEDLSQFRATVECDLPNRHLYEFSGVLKEQNKQKLSLGPDQVLLRGSLLRNTKWVFGLVVYTGHETKLMKNSTSAPLKRSSVDKLINKQILILFMILIVLCLISASCSEWWSYTHGDNDWYLGLAYPSKNFGYNLLTFMILYNNLIPISLQVTLEMVRFIQATFINMDIDMYHPQTNTPAMARTSNLNEELGMVKYVFSDKTGTLTRNEMVFKQMSVGGILYKPAENLKDTLLFQHIDQNHENASLLREFLVLMSVCHTVIPEQMSDGVIQYHASSPDERALVQGASMFGFTFDTRTPSSVEIVALGKREKYEILHVIEFTSTRKRMSVIARTPDNKIKLYCKGADTVIYERLSQGTQKAKEQTLKHLETFASEGLRTLCCAVADISPEAYEEWKDTYHKAKVSLQNRERKLDEAAELIETNLNLLGASAIEDKLQDQVPETISALIKADINVWVLTGDKQETAINIGYSCQLITQGMPILIVNEGSLDDTRDTIGRHIADFGEHLKKPNHAALVVDGHTLKYALTHDLQRDFLDLCISCKVVVCCRVSPMQKAEMVELVTVHTGAVTLAIGDGANDVAMIQKAHVGVGISGYEGLQAACASDYSIAQFRFLLKLLLVHGAWNYNRMCKLILYSFYKNICLYIIELWFAIYSGWSGQVMFERWTIGLYNVLFTASPPITMGIFDKVCSAEMMLQYPKLYAPSQNGEHLNARVFWGWIIVAIIHSIILYWLPMLMCQHDVLWDTGHDQSYLVLGNFVYTYTVVTVCLKAGLVTNSWTWLTHAAIWGSILTWFLFVVIYSAFWPTIPLGAVMSGMDKMMFTSLVFWLGLFLIPFSTLIIDVTYKVISTSTHKSLTDAVRESEIRKSDPGIIMAESKTHDYHRGYGSGIAAWNSLLESNQRFKFNFHRVVQVFRDIYYNGREFFSISEKLVNGCDDSRCCRERSIFERTFMHCMWCTDRTGTTPEECFQPALSNKDGFAFSQEEGGAVAQSDVIRAYNTNLPKPGGM